MGYCGLEDWTSSDMAAGCFADISDSIKKILKKNIKSEKGNQYNTNGIVNAALIIKDLGEAFWLDWEFVEYVEEEFLPIFEEYVVDQKNDKEWKKDDLKSYSWHVAEYGKMLRQIKRLVNNAGSS